MLAASVGGCLGDDPIAGREDAVPVDVVTPDVAAADADGVTDILVEMTLTSPNCPVAQDMPDMVRNALMPIPGVGEVRVEIVFDPPWDKSFMAETAKLQLNMF